MGRSVPMPWIVLAGTGGLWVAGLVTLGLIGASPSGGWRVNRALDQLAGGRRADAATELDRVAAAHPDRPSAWIRAGRALAAAGQPAEGADRLAHAASLDPGSATARYEWAKALLAGGFDDDAERVLQELLEAHPGHADARFLAAATAAGRGDAALAADRFEAALAAGCSSPDRWRTEPRFDRVRGDLRFLRVARDLTLAGAAAAVRP